MAKKRRRIPKKRYRATMNSAEGTKNLKQHARQKIAFDRACVEESAARACSQKERSMDGYKIGTENDPDDLNPDSQNPDG